jgi:hypothetical protein
MLEQHYGDNLSEAKPVDWNVNIPRNIGLGRGIGLRCA